MKIIENIAIKLKMWGSVRNYSVLTNVLLVVFLIGFSNSGFLPIENMGDFYFIFFIVLTLALYRPGWTFLLFVGIIGLENINLAPEKLGLTVRPYQLLGSAILIAIGARYFSKRLNFKLFKLKIIDGLVIVFVLAGFISSIGADDKYIALKHSIVITSFVALYFLVRIFIRNTDDLKKILPFFLSSFLITALYGIWQNWQFLHNRNHFEIMPGRPNSTFVEADWLGIYIVFLISILYAIIFCFDSYFKNNLKFSIFNFRFSTFKQFSISNDKIKKIAIYLLLIIAYIVLILTVSRSAWLGAIVVNALYIAMVIWYFGIIQKLWRTVCQILQYLVIVGFCSIGIIHIFGLTNFELGNRLQSTGGEQEITVSCTNIEKINLSDRVIESMDRLKQMDCRHINLEEIEAEKIAGNIIMKVNRPDPNVNIRAEIYRKSWVEIKKHPILGIGWGNIGNILGTDERGAGLNSSNIFLEIWLGAGLLGLISFVLLLSLILGRGINGFFRKNQILVGIFLILSFFAVVVPNLFNAGIMLGFIWIWLGVAMMEDEKN